MNNEEKVWIVIYRDNNHSRDFLLLKPSPQKGRSKDYYVITGTVENNETLLKTIEREIEEEIGIKPLKITDLKKVYDYVDKLTGRNIKEYCFSAEIGNQNIKLNEEHIDYKWVSKQEFIDTIWWEGDKKVLEDLIKNL